MKKNSLCVFVCVKVKGTFSIKRRKYRFLHNSQIRWGGYSSISIVVSVPGSKNFFQIKYGNTILPHFQDWVMICRICLNVRAHAW